MLLSDYLFNETKEIWDKYLKHPFIVEMGEGVLDKEKFKEYLIQDYLYLLKYAKVYAVGLVKSNKVEHMKFFKESINSIMEDESATHIDYLKDLGENIQNIENYELKIENENYTNFMLAISLQGDIQEIVVSLLPCAWSYYYIAKYMKEKFKDSLDGNYYSKWIKSYCEDDYEKCVNETISFVDEISIGLKDEKKEKLKEIFIKGSLYELEFWDMAYEEIKKC